ncbi:MAG: hypothetical protein ABIA62_03005 [Candidatus Woesearchaeota archaeon]
MVNDETVNDTLADILFNEFCRPVDTDVDHINSIRYDEALIVLTYVLAEYSKADEAGKPDSYTLPDGFAPQSRMKELFEKAFKQEYDWTPETESMKHKKCSIIYTNIKQVSDGYRTTLSGKIQDIDTLIHDGLNNQCASHGGRIDRPISHEDKFIEQN